MTRRALVTGAGSGIGAACVERFLADVNAVLGGERAAPAESATSVAPSGAPEHALGSPLELA